MQPLGGTSEVLLLGDSDEVADQSKLGRHERHATQRVSAQRGPVLDIRVAAPHAGERHFNRGRRLRTARNGNDHEQAAVRQHFPARRAVRVAEDRRGVPHLVPRGRREPERRPS